MSRFERISKRALLLAVLTAATAATSAQAGRYHVYTCRTPSGASAPADGWTGSSPPEPYEHTRRHLRGREGH